MLGKPFLHCGGNTLDKYSIQILKSAYKNIDDIYAYISNKLLAPDSAVNLVSKLEEFIALKKYLSYVIIKPNIGGNNVIN